MTKKKTRKPKPVLAEPFESKLREHTTEGIWSGLPNYLCRYCEDAHVDPQAALDHFVSAHVPKPDAPARKINTGLIDEAGAPLLRDEPAPSEEVGS